VKAKWLKVLMQLETDRTSLLSPFKCKLLEM